MAIESKPTKADSHEVAALRVKEKSLVDKLERLKKLDVDAHQEQARDIPASIQRTELGLVEVRKAIREATK